jgi:hypothetical protein
MLDLHCEQIDNKYFVINCNDNFILSYADSFDTGLECKISNNSLCVYQNIRR